MVRKYQRFLRFSFWRVSQESLSAHSISLGFAIGTFVALSPTLGIQFILAILLSLRFNTSKLAAVLMVFITNPITAIPIYTFEFFVGSFLLQGWIDPQVDIFREAVVNLDFYRIKKLGSDTLIAFLFGSFLMSFIGGFAAYFISKPIILKAKKKNILAKNL